MASPNLNAGQFTVGPNCSVAIYQGGSELDIGLITQINFDIKTRIDKKEANLMSGFCFEIPFLKGWQGSISIQRTNANLDIFWATVENNYRAGLPYPTVNIIQTIRETDLSTTRFTFQGSMLYYDEGGRFANEELVTQTLSFSAPLRNVENS
jgi:hypothetical protein